MATTTSVRLPTTTTIPPSVTTLPPSTSITTLPPSTTVVPPTTTLQPTTIVQSITSIVTQTPQGGGTIVTTITSLQPVVTITPTASEASSRSSSSTSSSQTALSANGSGSSSNGLSSGATIAIAVIIPIAAVIGFVILGLWFWRRRKAKKNAEELRKNEMAEYGYNPNSDPTLPVGAAYTDGASEANDDSGYRGWGATSSTNRKPSTTLGSNSRAAAMGGAGMSDHGSQAGYNAQPSPSGGSDQLSQDPLVHGYEAAGIGAAGASMTTAAIPPRHPNRDSRISGGVHRGPSNASSAYSVNGGMARSEADSDIPDMPNRSNYYEQEVPYNVYDQPGQHQYQENTYGQGDQPIIRDVQARRNTRIQTAPNPPQQGGIAQNF